jgi:glycosyltransferase domain-containing protein
LLLRFFKKKLNKLKVSNLEKLTIVVYSYNRKKYLERTIRYWLNFDVRLLILDGSKVKLSCPSLSEKKLKYIHDTRGLYPRMLNSINHINTEFVILACDDEFYLPSALSACVEFLLREPSFFSCGGRSIGFGISNGGKKIFGCEQYPKFRNLCLDDSNVLKRIQSHFNNYVPAHTYSVIRSSKWKIICKHVFEKEYNFFAAMELQMEFLVMVSGKSKIISELMWLRNIEVSGIRGTSPSTTPTFTIDQWWYDKKFKKEKKNFLYRMKKACDELLSDQNIQLTENVIARLFEIYINNLISKNILYKKIKYLIPIKIRMLIGSILSFRNKSIMNKYKSLADEASLLESEGVFVNHEDLNQIILALRQSNY